MSNDAPTSWKNLTDALITTDAYRAVGAWIGSTFQGMSRYALEKLLDIAAGDNIQNYPHSHGELVAQSSLSVAYRDGVVARRTLVAQNYAYQYDATTRYDYIEKTLDDTWTLLNQWRIWIGGFQSLWCEVEFLNQQAASYGVYFKIEQWDNDGASAKHYIEETTTTAAASRTWHTIYGYQDGALPSSKHLIIGAPAGLTDYADSIGWRTIKLYAKKDPTPASDYIDLYNVHIFEQLTLES